MYISSSKKVSGTKTNPCCRKGAHSSNPVLRQPLLFHSSVQSACRLHFTNASLGLLNIYGSFKILFKFHLLSETFSYSMASCSLIPSPNDTLKHLLPQNAFILHKSVFLITLWTSSGQGSSSNNLYVVSARAPHGSSRSAAEGTGLPAMRTAVLSKVRELGWPHLPEKRQRPSTAECPEDSPEPSC